MRRRSAHRLRGRRPYRPPGVEHRVRGRHEHELALGLVRQQPPRLDRAGRGGRGRRSDQRPARILGRARDAVGAAHERVVDRVHRGPGARRDRDRIRHRRRAAAGDRQRHDGVVGRATGRRAGRRVFARHGPVRRRPGGVHGDRRGAVQPARPGRVEGRRRPDRGRGARVRGQRLGWVAVLATRRQRGRRRRPCGRLPPGCLIPVPGGRLGHRRASDPSRHRGRGADRGGAPR